MSEVRRRISMSELGGAAPSSAAVDTQELSKVLGGLGKGLSEIQALKSRMDSAEASCAQMMKMCDKMQEVHTETKTRLAAVERYLKDHADTHRDMNNAHGTQIADLVKLVRNVTGQFSAMQDVVGGALKDMATRRDVPVVIKTEVNAPPVTVQNSVNIPPETEHEPSSFTFDIKRNQGGLIESVVARPGNV